MEGGLEVSAAVRRILIKQPSRARCRSPEERRADETEGVSVRGVAEGLDTGVRRARVRRRHHGGSSQCRGHAEGPEEGPRHYGLLRRPPQVVPADDPSELLSIQELDP